MVVEMDMAGVLETRKVSFDDLVGGSIASDADDLSIQDLVSVPGNFDDIHSDCFQLLPAIPTTPPTPDLYSCFEPPQNPETMRKRREYRTIVPAPDYCSIYSGYDWQRMSFGTSKRLRKEDSRSEQSKESWGLKFTNLLHRLASSMRRSEESRSAILDHHEDFKDCFDEEKSSEEVLVNQTRSQVLDMICKELNHVDKGVNSVIEESDEEGSRHGDDGEWSTR